MENKKEDPLFEIYDPEVNTSDIMKELETNLLKRNITKEEIDRIIRLNLSAESASGYGEFDPAYTAHLFEKGISAPKFTNPAFRFVKGPLKWLLIKIVEFYTIFDKKISQNRIKAFYSVVNELIVIKNNYKKLKEKNDHLLSELLEIKSQIGSNHFEFNYFDSDRPYSQVINIIDREFLKLLKEKNNLLVLFPEWGNFLSLLLADKIKFIAVTDSELMTNFIQKEISGNIRKLNLPLCLEDLRGHSTIILHKNCNLLPAWFIEKFLDLVSQLNHSCDVLFGFGDYDTSSASAFKSRYFTYIELDNLKENLSERGFKNIFIHTIKEYNYSIVSFQKP